LPEELAALGVDPAQLGGRRVRRARGCRACEGTGYRGRVAVFALLELDAGLRDLVFRGEGLEAVRVHAAQSGALRPLITDCARKVLRGETTLEEVARVTKLAGHERAAGTAGAGSTEER
jgi:type II secretory ATPase GspE/PulE/Tfp pilus assembly ATPase PilB-like protein